MKNNLNIPESTGVLRDKVVAVVDMVGYSSVARMLEENGGPGMVAQLNAQIEQFVATGLAGVGEVGEATAIAQTGDGAILMFNSSDQAFRFAFAVHEAVRVHNLPKMDISARRLFRIGVALGSITWEIKGKSTKEFAGITIANAVRLQTAAKAGEIVMDTAAYEGLSQEFKDGFGPEQNAKGKREEVFRVRRWHSAEASENQRRAGMLRITRRWVIGTGVAAAATAGAWFEWPRIRQSLSDLPQKRFVALVAWPPVEDQALAPTMSVLVEAIGAALIRAEAYEHDLLVIPPSHGDPVGQDATWSALRDKLGTNLALTVNGKTHGADMQMLLQVLDTTSNKTLRKSEFNWPVADQLALPAKATSAAAELLNIRERARGTKDDAVGTHSAAAYLAFQQGESLWLKNNDAGLNEAIEKYKSAIDIDSKYVAAYAKLAQAYFRYYVVKADSGALGLARDNAQTAVTLDGNSVLAHVVLAEVLVETGDEKAGQRELATALAIDPRDSHTLVVQGQLYAQLNQWSEAERSLQRAKAARPNYWLPRNELGIVLQSQGKYQDALGEFRSAGLAAPGSALPLANIGTVYLQQGQYNEARDYLKRSLTISPLAFANVRLAQVSRATNNALAALKYAQTSVELDASSCGNWVELGDCFELLKGHADEAKDAYRRGAMAERENLLTQLHDGPGWLALALCLAKSGDRSGAESAFAKASGYPVGDMESQLLLARVFMELGKPGEVARVLKEFEERGGTKQEIGLSF